MKIIKRCLLSLVVLTVAIASRAQSADDIIAKYLAAVGGKEKLAGITSVKFTNTMNIMGSDAPATVTIVNGKGFRSESEFNGQKIVQVVTDQGGWMINPMMGSSDPQPLPASQLASAKDQIYIVPFLDYTVRGNKAELLGQEKVGNVNAYKIKITDKDNNSTTYYFDPSTYYLIQAVRTADMMGQPTEVTTTYSDFQKTDYGWTVPHATEVNFGGQFSMTGKVQKVEVNAPVDASIFEMKK